VSGKKRIIILGIFCFFIILNGQLFDVQNEAVDFLCLSRESGNIERLKYGVLTFGWEHFC